MEQGEKILNKSEVVARENVEMEKEKSGEKMSEEKNELELFIEEMKAENGAFEQTIVLAASLRGEQTAGAKKEERKTAAPEENLTDSEQIKKEYEAALQSAKAQFSLAENFKQEAAKRLKILQDLNITSSADISRLNFLLAEIITALAEAKEQKNSVFMEKAEQLALAYKKIRLKEEGFHSLEEAEEVKTKVYQKQIRVIEDETERKKKQYGGLGRLIKRKEIKRDWAEHKRLRDVHEKLGDLSYDVRTVGTPLAELVSRQRDISIDINDLSKAGSNNGLKKIYYRQTDLIRQINFTEPEAFNEAALGSPEEMYFTAQQKGVVDGPREVVRDKAPHEKIAWLIKNAVPLAKAREVMKSFNIFLKKTEKAGFDPNVGFILFDDALRNSAFKQFERYDNEIEFIKDINIDLWNIYRNNEKAWEFFGQENMEATDRFLANEITYELLKTEQHTAKSVDLGEKLLYFSGADTAPLAVLNSYRESGRSGEQPFLSVHRKSEDSNLFKFITKLDEKQLKIIKERRLPGLYEIVMAIKQNPATFNSDLIKNPKIAEFIEVLKNNEEFLDYVSEQSFSPVEKFEIGGEEKERVYNETTKEYYINMERLKELLPDALLNDDVASIEKDNPLFIQLKRVLVRDSLKTCGLRPADLRYSGFIINDTASGEEYYTCPEEKIAYFLEKQNYSKNLFDNPQVFNPLYDEIQQNLVKLADYYLKTGQPEMKFYLMDLLRKLKADLNGAYEEMAKILTGPPDYLLQKQTVDCLIARVDDYRQGDKKALATILNCHELALNVKKDIEQKAHKFINFLLREDQRFSKDEREYFEELVSKVVGCSPADLARTVDFLNQIGRAGYYLYCNSEEDIKIYIDLSRNPAMSPFIQELLKDGFNLVSIIEKRMLQEIYERRALILPTARKLREYKLGFDLGRNFEQIKEIAENDLLSLFEEYKNKEGSPVFEFIFEHAKELGAVPKEKRQDYLEIFLKIDESPSQEIQRLKDQLLKGLLETDNPSGSYEKINDIFVKNNLPTVGKVFKVFEVLHKPEEIKRKLSRGSPVLTQTKSKRRLYDIFYRDLLKIHIDSGNRSLRQYSEILNEGEEILSQAETAGIDNLTYAQSKKLEYFFDKIGTLFVNSALGRNFAVQTETGGKEMLNEQYQNLRRSLACKKEQKITERISEMFLKPVGLNSLADVLSQMWRAKSAADERGRQYAQEVGEGALEIQAGDLLKGVDANYIENILQNGSVAKEFLGAGASSDSTPFDTDVSRVEAGDLNEGFKSAVAQSLAVNYGELLFCVKDRGQFELTEQKEPAKYNSRQLELFKTGAGKHYGVRTGFPTTEIDFMIAKDSLWQDKRKFNKICYEIAQNGWYLPITDTTGKIIFTRQCMMNTEKHLTD